MRFVDTDMEFRVTYRGADDLYLPLAPFLMQLHSLGVIHLRIVDTCFNFPFTFRPDAGGNIFRFLSRD